jgi:hypothetical protein
MISSNKEASMKHQIPEEVMSTAELLPLLDKSVELSVGERLELWAKALERYGGPLDALRRLEHLSTDELRAYRGDNTPLTVAFKDPALRAAGLSGDSLGDMMDFFDLSDRDAHWLLCDCHHVGTMTGDGLAKRLRHHARWAQFRAGLRQIFRRLLGFTA